MLQASAPAASPLTLTQQIKAFSNDKVPTGDKLQEYVLLVKKAITTNDPSALQAIKEKEFKHDLAIALLQSTEKVLSNLAIIQFAANLMTGPLNSRTLAETEAFLASPLSLSQPSGLAWGASMAYSALSALTSLVRSPAAEEKNPENAVPIPTERLFSIFFGDNPLHKIAFYGETAKIDAAHQAGNPITGQDTYHQTPLMVAAARSSIVTVRKFISVGGAAGIKDKKSAFHDKTLHYAARNADPAVVDAIYQQDPELIRAQNKIKQTPLHVACQNGLEETALRLLALGAKIDEEDVNGFNAIHYCVKYKHGDLARKLAPVTTPDDGKDLARAQLVKADKNGRTPAHLAIDSNDRPLLMYFVSVNPELLDNSFPISGADAEQKETFLLDYFTKHAGKSLSLDEIEKANQLLDLGAKVNCSGKEHSHWKTAAQHLDNIIYARRAQRLAHFRQEAALEKHQAPMTIYYYEEQSTKTLTESKANVLKQLIAFIEERPCVDIARCIADWEKANPSLQLLLDAPDESLHGSLKRASSSVAATGAMVRKYAGSMFAQSRINSLVAKPAPIVPEKTVELNGESNGRQPADALVATGSEPPVVSAFEPS